MPGGINNETQIFGGNSNRNNPMSGVRRENYSQVQMLLKDLEFAKAFGDTKKIAYIEGQLKSLGYKLPADTKTTNQSIFSGGLKDFQKSGGYVVQKGDTLSSIAKQYGVSLQALIEANPQIKNPNSIQIGQGITIPPKNSQPSGVANSVPAESSGVNEQEPAVSGQSSQTPSTVTKESCSTTACKGVYYNEETGKFYKEVNGELVEMKASFKSSKGRCNIIQVLEDGSWVEESPKNENGVYLRGHVSSDGKNLIKQTKYMYDKNTGMTYADTDGDGDYNKFYDKDGNMYLDLNAPLSEEQEKSMKKAGRAPAVWYNPLTWF